MSHAARLMQAWAAAALVGVAPAAIWSWRSSAPLWFNAAQALANSVTVALIAAAPAVVALVAARARPDGGRRAAVGVAAGASVALWAALLYVRIRYA